MNRIIVLSFVDETTEFGDDISITGPMAKGPGVPVNYYIFPDGLCINTEGGPTCIASIYYILKGPSPDGIVPFIHDIVSFCDNVQISTITPTEIEGFLSAWRDKFPKEPLFERVSEQCLVLSKTKCTTDVSDIKRACVDLSERDEDNVIRYRGKIERPEN